MNNGGIYKARNGYRVMYSDGKDPMTGKRVRRSKGGFKTKKAAHEYLDEIFQTKLAEQYEDIIKERLYDAVIRNSNDRTSKAMLWEEYGRIMATAKRDIKTAVRQYFQGYKQPRKVKAGWGALRLDVLDRDGYTCQYCGKVAPDVVLHVDHVVPVSKGGGDDMGNLVTSCRECNLGKSARTVKNFSKV